ncbi:MAG TPA: protein kinase [Gemmatimonadales bacterium]|nr:protein kinase [Gemmatimonadales bacterium]
MTRDLQEQLQQSLGDAYRIERELGGGGMSRVFVAVETALQRKVVVKVLLPELAAGVSVERFRREIHLAAQLQHPHIVQLLSAGTSAGLPYFTMPYVDGESLRARLLRERELPVPQAVRVLRDVASALAYAHARGVVHRDIKPDNVLLSHGVAVVTDFGVAKALTVSSGPDLPTRTGAGLTSLGIALGTPAYMAPEQGAGDPGVDHRVDIYAFGIMAYEILTGEPPFTGPSPQAILGAHIAGLPRPIALSRPGIPPLLAHMVMKCLEKRPADRPQTADEIIGTLDMLSTPSGTVPATAVLPGTRVGRWRRSLGGFARRFGPAVAIVVLAAAVALLAWPRRGTTPMGPPPAAAPTDDALHSPAAEAIPPATSAETSLPTPPVAESAPPAPTRAPTPRAAPAPRPERDARVMSSEDSALLARLEQQAASARTRAVAAGVGDSLIARGDSSVSRAESLSGARRIAEAAVAFSSATALWSAATDRAQAAEAARAAAERTAEAEETVRIAEPPPADVPPTPAPPPERPPDSAPAPAPDPARQIDALFARYAAAIEARDLDAIRRAYPGLLPAQAREWEEFFGSVTDIDVELEVTDLAMKGDAAEARLEGVYVFRNPSTRRTQREPVSFLATLRREGARWLIASLR